MLQTRCLLGGRSCKLRPTGGDVYPDGRAYNLDETILRARYREGFDKEIMMEKGKVYKLTLSSMSTSNYFAPGHSIRIEVSSSNFPRFERN